MPSEQVRDGVVNHFKCTGPQKLQRRRVRLVDRRRQDRHLCAECRRTPYKYWYQGPARSGSHRPSIPAPWAIARRSMPKRERKPDSPMAIEVCATTNWRGRGIAELEHEVRLVPPVYIRLASCAYSIPSMTNFFRTRSTAAIFCQVSEGVRIPVLNLKSAIKQTIPTPGSRSASRYM